MGEISSKQSKKQEMRAKTKREVQSMYKMFDETIEVVKKSRLILSNYDKSTGQSIQSASKMAKKINNLEDVLQQLLQSFKRNSQHSWGPQIHKLFKYHFKGCFQQVWPINKEEFYQIILSQCRFQTIDFQKELQQLTTHLELSVPNRKSYKQLFYEYGAGKLQEHLPSCYISQTDQSVNEDLLTQTEEEKDQFDLNAINNTIMNNQQKQKLLEQDQQSQEFMPLFLKTEQKAFRKTKQQIQKQRQLAKKVRKQQIARIQGSSVIMAEAIFINRLNDEARTQIEDLVNFYRQFSSALQRLFFSVSLISSPFKHFVFVFTQKLSLKNIKHQKKMTKSVNLSETISSSRSRSSKQLLYGESQQAIKFRERRQINNNYILQEIRDFCQAYTEFLWKYLQLNEISDLKLGKMISTQNLYGIILKSVWKFFQFISERGFEYQERKIQDYCFQSQLPPYRHIPQQKKKHLLKVLQRLLRENNPQKYLKKIVVFYREVATFCESADDLLKLYMQLIIHVIKQGKSRDLGIVRMKNVIQRVLKIDGAYNGGGQIGYAWITWCALVQKLKFNAIQKHLKRKKSQQYNLITQPDHQQVYEQNMSSY